MCGSAIAETEDEVGATADFVKCVAAGGTKWIVVQTRGASEIVVLNTAEETSRIAFDRGRVCVDGVVAPDSVSAALHKINRNRLRGVADNELAAYCSAIVDAEEGSTVTGQHVSSRPYPYH